MKIDCSNIIDHAKTIVKDNGYENGFFFFFFFF